MEKYTPEEASQIRTYWTTPLHYEVSRGNEDGVARLLAIGCDVNAKGPGESTPLHLSFNNPGVMELLLKAGADVNALNADHMSPLDAVAVGGSAEAAERLVDSGATASGSALVSAARSGNTPVVVLLLSRGVPADAIVSGRTALFWAAHRSHTDAARVLLEFGANPRFEYQGKTVLQVAGSMKQQKGGLYSVGDGHRSAVARLLEESGAGPSG